MYKDVRGNELKIGDVVAFNHPCGYQSRELTVGKIVEFGRYVVIEVVNGKKVNKLISSLYKLHQN